MFLTACLLNNEQYNLSILEVVLCVVVVVIEYLSLGLVIETRELICGCG